MTIPRNLGTFAEYTGANNKTVFSVPNAGEVVTIAATAATGTVNYDVITQSVLYYTSNASGNWTLNIRGNASVSMNTFMATGQSVTFVHLVTNSSPAYYNSAVTIDGSSVTVSWLGGTAPSAGNANSLDVYSYTVMKTASATYKVIASLSKFA